MRIGTILLCCALLAGCSVKMAYNNFDRLVRWGVSDYVNLNREQKDLLQHEIERLHLWHRHNHLPQYAEFTNSLVFTISDGISEQTLADLFTQFEVWFDEVETEATPIVIAMLASLTDAQVEALPKRLEDANLELAEPELDKPLQESQARWADEFADVLKNFTGRLTKEQLAYLQRRSSEYQPERVLWVEYRRRYQQVLLDLLALRRDGETFAAAYKAFSAQREAYYGPDLTEVFANNKRLNRETAVYVLSNLTPRQSERFAERLHELSEDFQELAEQI